MMWIRTTSDHVSVLRSICLAMGKQSCAADMESSTIGIFPQFPVDPAAYACAVPNAFHIEKDLQTAMAQHWSFNIQHDLGFATLQVGYVGNHVTHLLTNGVVTPRNINRRDPVTQVRPL